MSNMAGISLSANQCLSLDNKTLLHAFMEMSHDFFPIDVTAQCNLAITTCQVTLAGV